MQVSDGLVSEWKVGSERKDSVETQAVVSEHVVTMGIEYPEIRLTCRVSHQIRMSLSSCRDKAISLAYSPISTTE